MWRRTADAGKHSVLEELQDSSKLMGKFTGIATVQLVNKKKRT
jgi:hypothetical protein